MELIINIELNPPQPPPLSARYDALFTLMRGPDARRDIPTTFEAWCNDNAHNIADTSRESAMRVNFVKACSAAAALCDWLTVHAVLPQALSLAQFQRFETMCRRLVAESTMNTACNALGLRTSDVVHKWAVPSSDAELIVASETILTACEWHRDTVFIR